MKQFWAIVCLVLGATSALADNVWVPPKGTFHLAFSFTGAQWDQFLQTGSYSVELPGDITQYELATYAEYAPIENLSIDVQIPFFASQKKFVFLQTDLGRIVGVQTGQNGEVRDVSTNYGIGDIVLGTKYIFWDKWVSVGGRAHLKIPGGYPSGNVVNAPGDGQVDFGLTLLTGANIPQIRSYMRASLGYVFRAGGAPSQLELWLEPGVNITQNFSARVFFQLVQAFGGTDINFYGLDNYFPENHEDSDRIGLGLGYKATEAIGFFGLYSQTVAGRNTANTKAITFGVDFTF